jgi:hypothetical protein
MPRALAVLEDLRRRIAALPGVESAFVTAGLPVDGQLWESTHWRWLPLPSLW